MIVRQLMKQLLDMDPEADVMCVNVNDPGDEEQGTTNDYHITSVGETDEGNAKIYFVGDAPTQEEGTEG